MLEFASLVEPVKNSSVPQQQQPLTPVSTAIVCAFAGDTAMASAMFGVPFEFLPSGILMPCVNSGSASCCTELLPFNPTYKFFEVLSIASAPGSLPAKW